MSDKYQSLNDIYSMAEPASAPLNDAYFMGESTAPGGVSQAQSSQMAVLTEIERLEAELGHMDSCEKNRILQELGACKAAVVASPPNMPLNPAVASRAAAVAKEANEEVAKDMQQKLASPLGALAGMGVSGGESVGLASLGLFSPRELPGQQQSRETFFGMGA